MAKIPKFKSEEEEIKFWDTHSIADYWEDLEEVDIKFTDKRPANKRTTIYLNQSEHETLRKLAFIQKISMAEYIRQAVREKMKKCG